MTEPPITRRAAHGSKPNGRIIRIVIHATCPDVGFPAASKKGSASGTAKYFEMDSSGGSAHYVEGIDREEHCVPEDVSAWHAPPNPGSVGIEITADGGDAGAFRVREHAYTREQWLSPEVWPAVERAAIRTREICDRRGIPKRRLTVAQVKADAEGICGHVDVSAAFGQSSHSDPGPAFPWDRFMALVNNQQEADVPLTNAEIDAIAKRVWQYDQDGKREQAWAYQIRAAVDDVPALAAAVKKVLPAGSAPITTEQLETALRAVIGSVDN